MRKIPMLATAAATAAVMACGAVGSAHASAAPARHGFGFDAAAARSHETALSHIGVRTMGAPKAVRTAATLPASYSLKQYALTPGDQGQVGSCVTWATGYSGYGVLMNEQSISGDPMAPMFIYSQIAKGNDTGTYASVALPMEQQQGIDTKSDYFQGDFDYTTQPTAAEKANAANYKLSGYTDLTNASDRQTAIETAISSGLPVAIGFVARSSFENLNTTNYTYNPSKHERVLGGHEVTIVGYTSTGVEIENSWGPSWGNHGYFIAPWSWVTSRDVDEVNSMGKLVPTS